MRVLSSLFLSILLLTIIVPSVDAGKIVEDYQDITYDALKIAPEKYDKDKVKYEAEYIVYSTTFPSYMEKSGLSSKKHLLLAIGDHKIPAVADKTDTMVAFIGKLEKGSTVKVYGKVRKFRVDPRFKGMAAEYYVEVEKIELVAKPKDDEGGKNDGGGNNDRQPRKPLRPRIRK